MFDKLFDFFFQIVGMFQFWTVIDAFEEGVLLRFGKFKKTLKPGLRFILPFYIDNVLTDNVVTDPMTLGTQSLTTKDGKSIVISAVITWRIFDIRKVLLEVDGAESALVDVSAGYIHEQVAQNTWATIRKPDFPNSLKKHIQRQARKWGISVTNVQFSDCSLSRSYRLWTRGE